MGRFEIVFHREAAKAFHEFPSTIRKRIEAAIEALQENPTFGKDIRKPKGEFAGLYRLRVGEYRIIYHVDEKRKIVTIEAIGTRGEVY